MKYSEVLELCNNQSDDETFKLQDRKLYDITREDQLTYTDFGGLKCNWAELIKSTLTDEELRSLDSESPRTVSLVEEKISAWRVLDLSEELYSSISDECANAERDIKDDGENSSYAVNIVLGDLFDRKPELLGAKQMEDGSIQMPKDGLPPKAVKSSPRAFLSDSDGYAVERKRLDAERQRDFKKSTVKQTQYGGFLHTI